ncbi:hypothetical protein GCM10009117_21590 [Gangjinia marincola]|uniref:Riboflavin synthase subunit beta n=1 Tax=Gangjinia marincola TaxID=578463 RepID=A0ABN1MIM3_9FLAO
MLGNVFKTRGNNKFSYTPRYYKSDKEGSPFEIEHKFDPYRKTVNGPRGLKNKAQAAFEELKQPADRRVNKTILYVVLILVFLFLWLIDFDLSIFSTPR